MPPTGKIVADGDSITFGTNAPAGWPSIAATAMAGITGTISWSNLAIPGSTIAGSLSMVARAATADALFSGGLTNIITAFAGTNSMGSAGMAWYHAANQLLGYCGARRAKGWTVIVATMAARTNVGGAYSVAALEAQRLLFNAKVRSEFAPYAHALVDVGADPFMGNQAYTTDLAYFTADLLHPSAGGQARLAARFQAAITPYLL